MVTGIHQDREAVKSLLEEDILHPGSKEDKDLPVASAGVWAYMCLSSLFTFGSLGVVYAKRGD